MTESSSPAEPTLADVLAALTALQSTVTVLQDTVTAGFGASVERDNALADRLVTRTDLIRADVAAVKAELAIEEAFGRDTVTALKRHAADPHAHEQRAA